MYFPEKITLIKHGDRVLEIGPGVSPYHRSDILLEKSFLNDDDLVRQCGGIPASLTDPRTIYYDGGIFPFTDKEFDYVICSHVIEHVPNVEFFLKEMFRVAKAGYLEFPLVYYDFVFNIPEHLNLCIYQADCFIYAEKAIIFSDELKAVQNFWYTALASGYTNTFSELAPYTMQGFEWVAPFKIRKTEKIEDITPELVIIPLKQPQQNLFNRLQNKLKRMLIINGKL